MSNNFVAFNREQFRLLREAKRLVLKEFDQQLSLQDSDVVENIYKYALESDDEALFDIFEQLKGPAQSPDSKSSSVDTINAASKDSKKGSSDNALKVGDMVDGRRCVGFYRGQPVFK